MGIASTDIPRSSVNWMEVARTCANLVPFNMANLLYSCALPSAAHAVHGDYTYALAKLKRYLLFYQQEKVPLLYVLDGRTNCFKANEDLRRNQDRQQALAEIEARRQSGEEPNVKLYRKCLSNTSRYIGLVARLLQSMELPFIVAPGEADGQLAACAKDGVVISSDNDMLALGVVRKVRVLAGGWMSGETEMLSLVDCPPSSNSDPDPDPDHSVSDSTKVKKTVPLRDVYRQHGVDGLVYFAATCGCDFTPMKSGIPRVGPTTTICVLLLSVEGRLTPRSFTDLVKNNMNDLKQMPEEF
jgi:5'-3' exonuclease